VLDERLLGLTGAARERGRRLFTSRTLGAVSASCATCHRIADLAPAARAYPRYNIFLRDVITLEQAQNACLTRFMRGSPLPPGSRNAVSLAIFLVGD
jgi:cytochrome c